MASGPPDESRDTLQSSCRVVSGKRAIAIAIARVTLPDHLDTRDILVRHGAVLESSSTGRWAGRLSLGITKLATGRLGLSRPDALVTDQPQTTAPSYRLLVNVSRLDLAAEGGTTQGTATLEADWQIIPRDPAIPASRDRTRMDVVGPMATDSDVVALTTAILNRLATTIDLTPSLPPIQEHAFFLGHYTSPATRVALHSRHGGVRRCVFGPLLARD